VAAERPVSAGRGWPAGLPLPLTTLIGRDRDLREVAALLTGGRLVTLVGAGGVGKTRLAIEAAATVAPRFSDGVDLVDLSGVPKQELVWSAVAKAAGVEERDDADLAQRLVKVLRSQVRLVVLDNCEHLLAACASVVTQLLGYCPELRILATGREGLGVPGEVTWRVPSLAFPWPEHPPALEELEEFGAVALFADRARAARPGLEIAPTDVGAVTSICFRLDGIPLALELAATRVSALSVREIADHLDDHFALLTGAVGVPARHQTLRASVEWSHQLLTQPERALLRRLAVFAGGWSLHAAQEVCTGPPIRAGQVVRLLAALVDKSLVQAQDTATGTRYRLLEAIRTYAHELLAASGELDDIRAEHGSYFPSLCEHAATGLHGPDQGDWARRLDQDQANLRAARLWCAAAPARAGLGLKMASGLGEYWFIRGLLHEGTDWLQEALEQAPDAGGARATALYWLAVFTGIRSRFRRGGELYEASIALHEQAGDRDGEAQALGGLGFLRVSQDDRQGAIEALDRALALAGQSPDQYSAAVAFLMAGLTASLMADKALAKAHAAKSAELFTEIGDLRGAGYARSVLAECLILEGVPREGLAILQACVGDFEAVLDRWGLLISTETAALAHAAVGDWSRAAIAAGVADSLSERIGGEPFPPGKAPIDTIRATLTAELGAAATALREAGRAAGRSDQIGAALGLAAQPAPPQPQHDLPLTRREQEITELIATGLTNRQIAERLFIAQRTVDTHVAHILDKLGCTNRAQVAALTAARKPAVPEA